MSEGPCMVCCNWPCGTLNSHAVHSLCNSEKDLLYSLTLVRPCSQWSSLRMFLPPIDTKLLHNAREFSDSSLSLLVSSCGYMSAEISIVFSVSHGPAATPASLLSEFLEDCQYLLALSCKTLLDIIFVILSVTVGSGAAPAALFSKFIKCSRTFSVL